MSLRPKYRGRCSDSPVLTDHDNPCTVYPPNWGQPQITAKTTPELETGSYRDDKYMIIYDPTKPLDPSNPASIPTEKMGLKELVDQVAVDATAMYWASSNW